VSILIDAAQRKLHKAFLRYHDPAHWQLLHDTLIKMGRADLIGDASHCLIPKTQPEVDSGYQSPRRKNSTPKSGTSKSAAKKPQRLLTQHTGLPPRDTGAKNRHRKTVRNPVKSR